MCLLLKGAAQLTFCRPASICRDVTNFYAHRALRLPGNGTSTLEAQVASAADASSPFRPPAPPTRPRAVCVSYFLPFPLPPALEAKHIPGSLRLSKALLCSLALGARVLASREVAARSGAGGRAGETRTPPTRGQVPVVRTNRSSIRVARATPAPKSNCRERCASARERLWREMLSCQRGRCEWES